MAQLDEAKIGPAAPIDASIEEEELASLVHVGATQARSCTATPVRSE